MDSHYNSLVKAEYLAQKEEHIKSLIICRDPVDPLHSDQIMKDFILAQKLSRESSGEEPKVSAASSSKEQRYVIFFNQIADMSCFKTCVYVSPSG